MFSFFFLLPHAPNIRAATTTERAIVTRFILQYDSFQGTKVVQIERNTKQKQLFLFLFPRCSHCNAVDDYLAYCEEEGIEPDKSYTGVLNVRLTPAIHRQIAILARQAGLTLNAFIKEAVEEKVESAVAV